LGFIRVSSTVYPWVLLFGIQIILPNISFLGHLSGILVGISQVYGILDIFCLPSPEYLYSLDQAEFFTSRLQSIGISEKYIRSAPPSDSSWTSIRRDPSSLFKSLYESAIMIVSLIWNFVETLKVIIFGSRFRTEDMNILQSTFDDYDEEEFVGLPTTSR
jgi:rhomboid domain-containing protein 1